MANSTTAAWKVLGLRCAQSIEWKLRRLIIQAPAQSGQTNEGGTVFGTEGTACAEAQKRGKVEAVTVCLEHKEQEPD